MHQFPDAKERGKNVIYFIKRCCAVLLFLALIFPSGLSAAAEVKPLYTAKTDMQCLLRAEKKSGADAVSSIPMGATVEILEVDPQWATVRYRGKTGYLSRNRLINVRTVDPENTPPYGIQKHAYIATLAVDAPVYESMDAGSGILNTIGQGAKISIVGMVDGWAKIAYWRTFGYIDSRHLTDLIPVSPTDTPISGETPIAAFTTFYDHTTDTEANLGRMVNLIVSCEYLNLTLPAGKTLDYNEDIGPFSASRGYKRGPVFVDGTTKMGFGGGTCQVSATLYNLVMQLPQINVILRRSHGANGSVYVPIGNDASVGTDSLNLIFRNEYDFPIRVEAKAQDGAVFMCIWKQ